MSQDAAGVLGEPQLVHQSVERIFRLPINPRVQTATDFADAFEPGFFP